MGLFNLSPVPAQQAAGTKDFSAKASFAANAGASALFTLAIAKNSCAYFDCIVRASAGAVAAPLAITTVTNATEVFTLVAHGLLDGDPVIVGGTAVPTGITAGTVYFVGKIDADTFKLYATSADALVPQNPINCTSDGTAVTVTKTAIQAVYRVQGVVRNRLGYTTLVGSPSIVAFEDVAGWAATIAANNTDDTAEVSVTPDVDLATSYEVFGSYSIRHVAV